MRSQRHWSVLLGRWTAAAAYGCKDGTERIGDLAVQPGPGRLVEYSLQGQEIGRICLDYAVVLETVDGTELRTESPFKLSSSERMPPDEVRPDLLRETGSVVVQLLEARIVETSIRESGELSVRFASGQHLQCLPDDRFEAWTLVTATGERAVSMPGGGVAYWPASHTA